MDKTEALYIRRKLVVSDGKRSDSRRHFLHLDQQNAVEYLALNLALSRISWIACRADLRSPTQADSPERDTQLKSLD